MIFIHEHAVVHVQTQVPLLKEEYAINLLRSTLLLLGHFHEDLIIIRLAAGLFNFPHVAKGTIK